ncbi:hypothetical protein TNCV_433131 [Trichonephila clavipes]|nr:hypothetical protein TNCV_433131 [Trichonephila clavipes]
MFLAGHPSHGCFGLQSHCAPCYFFNKASFYPSDFSFRPNGDKPRNFETWSSDEDDSGSLVALVFEPVNGQRRPQVRVHGHSVTTANQASPKKGKSHEKCRVRSFKADRTTSKRIRYVFITVNSTTLIGLNSPRKNTTLPAVKSVNLRHTPNFLKPASC